MTKRVLFLGSKPLGLRCLFEIHRLNPQALLGVITIDDRDDVRSCFSEFHAFCENSGVDLFVASDRAHSEALIAKLRPDICLLVSWYWMVGEDTLRRVPNGCLGIHFSLLPKFRGWSPLVWTILLGESEAGLSLFTITKEADAGPLWEQRRVPIHFTDDVASVLARLEESAVDVLQEKYLSILDGSAIPRDQGADGISYCARRLPSDGLLDWKQSSSQLYDAIRAQAMPYPGAFTFLGRNKMTIWKARPKDTPFFGSPGQLVQTKEDGICAVCGDKRALVLEVVQLEGDPTPTSAKQAFRKQLNSANLSSGTVRFHAMRADTDGLVALRPET